MEDRLKGRGGWWLLIVGLAVIGWLLLAGAGAFAEVTASSSLQAELIPCPEELDTSEGQTCTRIEGVDASTNPADVRRAVCEARADEPEYVATFCDPEQISEFERAWLEVQEHEASAGAGG